MATLSSIIIRHKAANEKIIEALGLPDRLPPLRRNVPNPTELHGMRQAMAIAEILTASEPIPQVFGGPMPVVESEQDDLQPEPQENDNAIN